MKKASLTNHAKLRTKQRCTLSEESIKQLLDGEASVPIQLQKGGRLIHRLIYSSADQDWFMIVQAGGDGGVLTVMPLDYLTGRTPVTAAHKRQARSRALALASGAAESGPATRDEVPTPPANLPPLPGWKVQAHCRQAAALRCVNLGRTDPEVGGPDDWGNPGAVHQWLKSRLQEAGVHFAAVIGLYASRVSATRSVGFLMKHLPLTEEEICSCK